MVFELPAYYRAFDLGDTAGLVLPGWQTAWPQAAHQAAHNLIPTQSPHGRAPGHLSSDLMTRWWCLMSRRRREMILLQLVAGQILGQQPVSQLISPALPHRGISRSTTSSPASLLQQALPDGQSFSSQSGWQKSLAALSARCSAETAPSSCLRPMSTTHTVSTGSAARCLLGHLCCLCYQLCKQS